MKGEVVEILKNIIDSAWWTGKKVQYAAQETARNMAINSRIMRTEASLALDRATKDIRPVKKSKNK